MGGIVNLIGVPLSDTLELIKTGTISVTKPASVEAAEETLVHNLGFSPIFMAYLTGPEGSDFFVQLPDIQINYLDGTIDKMIYAYVDSETVGVYVQTPSTGSYYADEFTERITYFLLRVRAQSNVT